MKKKIIDIGILLFSILNVLILTILLRNMGIFADEFNTSLELILGNSFWNYAYWFMILFNVIIFALSILKLIKNKSNKY